MFHSSNPSLFGRPCGVLQQTRALHATAAALRGFSRSLAAEHADAPRARHALRRFSELLVRYFDPIERSGYLSVIQGQSEPLRSRVATLETTQGQLNGSIASLLTSRDTPDTAELGRGIGEIVDAFELQERDEQELLRDFFRNEPGEDALGVGTA